MIFSKRNNLLRTVQASVILIMFVAELLLPVGATLAASNFNKQINYQGKLTNSSGIPVTDGTYQMVFNLYTVASGGTAIWTETRSGANKRTVTDGLFCVL